MSGWTWKAPEPRVELPPDRHRARLCLDDPEAQEVLARILEFLDWDCVDPADPRPCEAEIWQVGAQLVVRDARRRETGLSFPIDPDRLLDALEPEGAEPSGPAVVLDE